MIQNPPQTRQFLDIEPAQERQIDFRQYLAVLFKYKWAIVSIALLAGLIGLYLAIKAVPIFVSQARLQIERDTSTQVLSNPLGYPVYNFEFYETQYELMRSWGVAALSAEKLGLLNIPENEPAPEASGGFNWRDWLPDAIRAPPRTLTVEENRANRIAGLRRSIQVRPLEASQLVDILIYHPNPQTAATRVNAVAEAYIDFLNDKKFESLQVDQNWYASRLESARTDLDVANQDLQDFYEQQDLLRGGTNEGGASLQQQRLQTALGNQSDAQPPLLEIVLDDLDELLHEADILVGRRCRSALALWWRLGFRLVLDRQRGFADLVREHHGVVADPDLIHRDAVGSRHHVDVGWRYVDDGAAAAAALVAEKRHGGYVRGVELPVDDRVARRRDRFLELIRAGRHTSGERSRSERDDEAGGEPVHS